MKERFEKYIKLTLDSIGNGENQKKYKQDMLNKLLDIEQECKIRGMEDEELIYNTCIDKLGDILQKHYEIEEKKEQAINKVRKIGIGTIISLCFLFATILAYLITSFVTKQWAQTWLIVVGGVIITIIIASIFIMIGFGKKQKWIPIRILTAINIVLIFTLTFLCMLILTDIQKTFVLFIIMVIMISGIDTAIAYGINAKTRIISLIFFIQIATSLEYVMLGVLKMVPWHPYWLIPVCGAFINMLIISIAIYSRYKNKKSQ